MLRAMKSLSPLNLQTSQIRNEEQNLRLSKEQELRRQHTFKNSLQKNKHMKNKMMMMMMMMTRP
jgi:hypothetical protein